jgi:hypothetical protein
VPRRSDVAETEWGFTVRATEDATVEAADIPVDGWEGLSERERAGLEWRFGQRRRLGSPLALATTQSLRAYVPTRFAVSLDGLPSGYYVHAVRLSAAMKPSRTSLYLSRPFRVP